MDLVCVKFSENMASEEAQCRHPGDFCRHRTACMIHFLEKERLHDEREAENGDLPIRRDDESHDNTKI